jgi:uncharacterized membrane protein
MEHLSRGVFVVASAILMVLASGLIIYSVYQIFEGLHSPEHAVATKLLDAVGYVIIAIAVFDVSKYLLEEEVMRGRELRNASEARRSLTKFISTIAIAVFLEALVMVFQASKKNASDMIYPTLLLLTGIALILGLGLFQRLSVGVEKEAGEDAESP